MKYLRVCCCIGLFLVAPKWRVLGQEEITTNSWTKGSGGKWEEVSAWSLGRLPDATQAVSIESVNEKTVVIDAATARQFPTSLSIHNLVLTNSNTLKLDRVGTAGALRIDVGTNRWMGLEVERGARVINLDSDITVDGYLRLIGGWAGQDGGVVSIKRATVIASGGSYALTNGLFEAAHTELPSSGIFRQYGGTARLLNTLRVVGASSYELHGGELVVAEGISLNDSSGFFQNGGTNVASLLSVGRPTWGEVGYVLNRGLLKLGTSSVGAGMSGAFFEQNGGVQVVTNAIRLTGSARYYPPQDITASYRVKNDAVLSAGSLEFDSSFGFCSFESSGQIQFRENIVYAGDADYQSRFQISGGVVASSNFVVESGVLNITQTGGALVVTNLFKFRGYYPGVYNGLNARPARYQFTSGTISAKDIELGADWIIGSSTATGRIDNAGTFRMTGTLRIGDAVEQFGKLTVVSNATINLEDGKAKISFARSNGEQWNTSALLTILMWGGSTHGGGADQVRFGNNRNGLSAEQLAQVQFMDPVGLPSGVYRAEMLETGEVVPVLTQRVFHTTTPGELVLTWQGTGVLQSSTNVAGPYESVPSAASPYIIEDFPGPQRFFRVIE
ncbi:MAG TPA: hypothetical protein VF773_09990 [Verrucomicrobiae bacterium]